jgi:hypothetical protein
MKKRMWIGAVIDGKLPWSLKGGLNNLVMDGNYGFIFGKTFRPKASDL